MHEQIETQKKRFGSLNLQPDSSKQTEGKVKYEGLSFERYRKTVAGVIYQNNEFLLVKKLHWGNCWGFVQGGVNDGESLEAALLRELREELGVKDFGTPTDTKIRWVRKFFEETLAYYKDRGNVGKILSYFVIEYLGRRNKIRLGDDLYDKKWRGKDEVISYLHSSEKPIAEEIIRQLEMDHVIK